MAALEVKALFEAQVIALEESILSIQKKRKRPGDVQYHKETDGKQLGVIESLVAFSERLKEVLRDMSWSPWDRELKEYAEELRRSTSSSGVYIRAKQAQNAAVVHYIDALLEGHVIPLFVHSMKVGTYTTRNGLKALIREEKYGDFSKELIYTGLIYKDDFGMYGQWDVNGFDRNDCSEYDLGHEGFAE